MTPLRVVIGCVVLSLATGASALAGPAFPWFSTIDPRLVLCPAGDIAFHVIPRRGTSPMANARLVVDFCASSGPVLCPGGQPVDLSFATPCQPSVYSDVHGLATFALKAGGITTDSTVALSIDGVPFGRRFLSSPDQNGDLVVDAADEAILTAKLGSGDLSADLDGDGVVTTADLAILRTHFGHGCERPTPTLQRDWGRLKLLYR
ncbi:MAG: hypothetical protein ACHQ52_11810 [Candidatus Eisenbacteria bacterium]